MAEAPHGRVRDGVAVGHCALGIDAQDLARERGGILRELGLAGIARRDVEHAVRTEGDASAVVDARLGDARDDVFPRAAQVLERHADDPVVLGRRGIGIEPRACRVDGDAEQAAFPVGGGLVDARGLGLAAVLSDADDAPGVPLAHERRSVGQPHEAPWRHQSRRAIARHAHHRRRSRRGSRDGARSRRIGAARGERNGREGGGDEGCGEARHPSTMRWEPGARDLGALPRVRCDGLPA